MSTLAKFESAPTDAIDGWTPAADVTLHSGGPLPADADFPIPPPAEIGPVFSAQSTLVRGVEPKPILMRLALLLLAVVAVWAAGDWLVEFVGPGRRFERELLRSSVMLLSGTAGIIAWFATRFRHKLSYVGRAGVARYRIRGSRQSPPKAEMLLFEQVLGLWTSEHRHYHHGVYAGTFYRFIWIDARDAQRFRLKGSYQSAKGTPKPNHDYWLATSAEAAWTEHVYPAALDELHRAGQVEFRLKKNRKNSVRVGHGWLEIQLGKDVNKVEAAEIKSLDTGHDKIKIKTHAARWFSGKGKFQLDISDITNARLFLLLLESLIQVEPSEGRGREG